MSERSFLAASKGIFILVSFFVFTSAFKSENTSCAFVILVLHTSGAKNGNEIGGKGNMVLVLMGSGV
jgi:hypothetical protein